MIDHKIATREEWLAARAELLKREKEHTRLGDELARQRRELPWVAVEKEYTLDTADGRKSLAELFDGRSQLLVYHFMFGPDYTAGCPTCSSMADGFSGLLPHLKAHDVTMICVSRAPVDKLLAYQRRMGWDFLWASSTTSDFSVDFGVSSTKEATREWVTPMLESGDLSPVAIQNARDCGTDAVSYLAEGPSVSVFAREGDAVYHCYSTTARGLEFLMGYYPVFDRTPKGRDESGEFQAWLHRHDEY
jgi:predicted dithiol-disulfide oxidoreductase (DUF899 family)